MASSTRLVVPPVHYPCHNVDCISAAFFCFQGQAVPVSCEQHRMEGMLLVHPPQGPPDAPFLAPPPPAPVADHVEFGGGGLAEDLASGCESPACSRQAKFGFQGAMPIACQLHRSETMVLRTRKGCEIADCHRAASWGANPKEPATACRVHKTAGMIDLKNKRCDAPGCARHRLYGVPGDKARFCSHHKGGGMVNVVTKRCSIAGCNRVPTHISQEDKSHRVCGAHKMEGMVDVSAHVKCDSPDCRRNPIFGFEGSKGSRCSEHKDEGMIDVKHARCLHVACPKVAAYAFEGQKPKFCYQHKKAGMHSRKHRKCEHRDCTRQSIYGFFGGRAEACSSHKTDGMENVMDRRCFELGCGKSPTFGPEDGRATACAAHKSAEMVNVRGRRCAFQGCSRQPRFGVPGEKPRVCIDHQEEGMTEIKQTFRERKRLKIASATATATTTATTTAGFALGSVAAGGSSSSPASVSPPTIPSARIALQPASDTAPRPMAVTFTPAPNGIATPELASPGVVLRDCASQGGAPQVGFSQAAAPQEVFELESLPQGIIAEAGVPRGSRNISATGVPIPHGYVSQGGTGVPHTALMHTTGVEPTSAALVTAVLGHDPLVSAHGMPMEALPAVLADDRTRTCAHHAQDEMASRVSSRCRFAGCSKVAVFGFDDETPRFCGGHSRDGMSDRVLASSCQAPHCLRGAVAGLDKTSESLCSIHKATITIGGEAGESLRTHCAWAGCLRWPLYAWSGEDAPRFCAKHTSPGMVEPSTRGRQCRYDGCAKQASFAFEGEACRFCDDHRMDGMWRAESRQCKYSGCEGLVLYALESRTAEAPFPTIPASQPLGSIVNDAISLAPSSVHLFPPSQHEQHGPVAATVVANEYPNDLSTRGSSGSGGVNGQSLENHRTDQASISAVGRGGHGERIVLPAGQRAQPAVSESSLPGTEPHPETQLQQLQTVIAEPQARHRGPSDNLHSAMASAVVSAHLDR